MMTLPSQTGCQSTSQRMSVGRAIPNPTKRGVTQRTRSHPGRVQRRSPLGGGAWAWVAWVTVVTLLGLRREVLHGLVELGRRDQRPEVRRHHVRLVAGRDVGVGRHDRLLDEVRERAAVSLRRLLLELVQIRTDLAARAGGSERVAAAAAELLERREAGGALLGRAAGPEPGGELRPRQDVDVAPPQRVAEAAELGAEDRGGARPRRRH